MSLELADSHFTKESLSALGFPKLPTSSVALSGIFDSTSFAGFPFLADSADDSGSGGEDRGEGALLGDGAFLIDDRSRLSREDREEA